MRRMRRLTLQALQRGIDVFGQGSRHERFGVLTCRGDRADSRLHWSGSDDEEVREDVGEAAAVEVGEFRRSEKRPFSLRRMKPWIASWDRRMIELSIAAQPSQVPKRAPWRNTPAALPSYAMCVPIDRLREPTCRLGKYACDVVVEHQEVLSHGTSEAVRPPTLRL